MLLVEYIWLTGLDEQRHSMAIIEENDNDPGCSDKFYLEMSVKVEGNCVCCVKHEHMQSHTKQSSHFN